MSNPDFKFIQHLLNEWLPAVRRWKMEENTIGHSSAKVYMLRSGERVEFVLKCQKEQFSFGLHRESRVLRWLAGKLPVPALMGYHKNAGWEYLCMEYLPGKMSYEWGRGKEEKLGGLLADTLRRIHSLSLEGCPYKGNLSYQSWKRLPPSAPKEPPEWDLVYSHGDFCLPNILIQGDALSGLIDLGSAGVYDRYHDLYWAEWSLRYNGLERGIPALWDQYGITRDAGRMALMAKL